MNVKRISMIGLLAIGLLIQPETYASNPIVHLKIYQNDILGIIIQGKDDKVNLRISNSLGEVLYKETTTISETYCKGFDFKKLTDGEYKVKFTYGKFIETHEFRIENGKVVLI